MLVALQSIKNVQTNWKKIPKISTAPLPLRSRSAPTPPYFFSSNVPLRFRSASAHPIFWSAPLHFPLPLRAHALPALVSRRKTIPVFFLLQLVSHIVPFTTILKLFFICQKNLITVNEKKIRLQVLFYISIPTPRVLDNKLFTWLKKLLLLKIEISISINSLLRLLRVATIIYFRFVLFSNNNNIMIRIYS